ncbi:hypothetical protein GCM10009067_26140 [Haloarcula sebkhae]|uniref:Uncharacterized protein n=1 Tax=Haloarcula sebkhae TaxID=932660 RepID=A0A830EME8_9EURY|nr:hypothetical protein GCM10009067_26140 [Haloarcula sebkhae]
MKTVSSSTKILQNAASVNEFLNTAATDPVPLFEHLEFDFLLEYDVFVSAPPAWPRTRFRCPERTETLRR